MLFNSFEFFIFFPVVTVFYFLIPHRFRWAWLLAASCYFYMAFIPAYILVLFFIILIDYFAGLYIEKSTGKKRKLFLLISIFGNIGLLAFFKYYGFTTENLNNLAQFLHWNYALPVLEIILPIGLSFHTFQALSYTIEVYRGRYQAEKHLGLYALYVMFYPQLVAGPIERPGHLLPQFREEHHFNYEQAVSGLRLMLWGLFKKMVIADRLAVFVDRVYSQPPEAGQGILLLLATVFFAFQIYADFSGYVDIARGAARVMGFRLFPNFNQPYLATSIADFWRRWHMTLCQWFRDYIYIPLGGNRRGPTRTAFNILAVFALTGLWHGAHWQFIVWGLLHGFYMVIARATKFWRQKLVSTLIRTKSFKIIYSIFQRLAVFTLVSIAWIFFLAASITDAVGILSRIYRDLFLSFDLSALATVSVFNLVAAFFLILFMVTFEFMANQPVCWQWFLRCPRWCRWLVYYAITTGIIAFGYFGDKIFIYFQF